MKPISIFQMMMMVMIIMMMRSGRTWIVAVPVRHDIVCAEMDAASVVVVVVVVDYVVVDYGDEVRLLPPLLLLLP